MTLKELSSLAGVSISTVSRILNDPNTNAASAEVKQKVQQLAIEYHYVPNQAAKSLRNTNLESTVSNTIYYTYAPPMEEVKDDSFYVTLSHAIMSETYRKGYRFGGFLSKSDTTFKTNEKEKMQSQSLIILGRLNHRFLNDFQKYFNHVVYICLNNLDLPIDGVICDGYDAAQEAVQCLYILGHTQIGFIGAFDDSRLTGFIDKLEDFELPVNYKAIVNTPLSLEGGYMGLNKIVNSSPKTSAIFCANDRIALGALKACKEKNIEIPQKLSLLGMNNISDTLRSDPNLSTINVPLTEMGRYAVELIVENQTHIRTNPIKVFFPHQLILRDSTLKKNRFS